MTALTQMAAARPPGIADARVPCPLCSGLVHPVAGRCKHCKEDLTSYRSSRAPAAAALPALLNGKPHNGTNGHAAATASAAHVAVEIIKEGSQPILPPRTTARSVPAQRTPSMWRSWPMLVIALAVVAIVAATIIMVLPPGDKKADGKMSAPPAPERMQTNPLMPDKHSQPADPWNDPHGGTVPRMPDPVAPAPPDPDDDIWGSGGGGGLSGGIASSALMVHVLDRSCKKLQSCPGVDQRMLKSVCDAVAMIPKPPAPTCAAAKQCFEKIDQLNCSQAVDDLLSPLSVYSLFESCSEADKC
jgi:hypothetical protein